MADVSVLTLKAATVKDEHVLPVADVSVHFDRCDYVAFFSGGTEEEDAEEEGGLRGRGVRC